MNQSLVKVHKTLADTREYFSFESCRQAHDEQKFPIFTPMASLVAQSVKNLPAKQDSRVRSLGWEDPVEKAVAAHSSILSWKIPWTEEPGGLQSMGVTRVGHNLVTKPQLS